MTRLEREVLEHLYAGTVLDGGWRRRVFAMRAERELGRKPDIAPGELVMFCEELGTKIRVRGEHQYMIPYDNVLAAIDDETILDEAIRAGRAGQLQVA